MRLAWRMQCSSSSLLLLRANSARVFSTSIDLNDPLMKRIHDYVTKDKLVVFMKGTPDAPQCGYSRAVVQILDIMKTPFSSYNVLADNDLREGIKKFSSWPTIPQVFLRGEFIGGADIMIQHFKAGELEAMLKDTPASESK